MKKNKNLKIELVDYGIANHFADGVIEIHKDLLKYPELLKPILKHELEHTTEGYKFKDFWIDFVPLKLNHFKLYWFVITKPKTWIQFSPIWFTKKRGLVIDVGHIFVLLLYSSLLFFLFRFLFGLL